MNSLRLTRREFLKLIGLTTTGAATGWKPRVEILPYESPVLVDQAARQRTLFASDLQFANVGDGLLSYMFMAPQDTQGEVDLTLLWTGKSREFGWWVDRLDWHQLGEDLGRCDPFAALPMTLRELQSEGPDLVNRDPLGSFPVKPSGLYSIGLYTPHLPYLLKEGAIRVLGLDLSWMA